MHHISTELPYNKSSPPHQCVRHCTFYLDIQLPVSCSFSPLAFPNRRDFCPQVRFTVYWKVAAAYKLNEEVAMQTNSAFHAIFHLSPRMGFVCESLCRFVPWLAWFGLSVVWSYKRQGLKLDECYWSRDSTFLQGSHLDWKTWKNGMAFSSQGKVREFWTDWKSQGKSHKILEKSLFAKMDHVFSLKKNKTLENTGNGKNILEIVREFCQSRKVITMFLCICGELMHFTSLLYLSVAMANFEASDSSNGWQIAQQCKHAIYLSAWKLGGIHIHHKVAGQRWKSTTR